MSREPSEAAGVLATGRTATGPERPEGTLTAPRAAGSLASGPIFGRMTELAFATLCTNLLQNAQGSINALWIGRLLDGDALAASYSVNLVIYVISTLVFGFGLAATILVGQKLGLGDIAAARRAFGASIGLCISAGVALSILAWVCGAQILSVMNAPPETFTLALSYLRMLLFSTPAAFLLLLINMGLRAAGDARTPLFVMAWLLLGDAALNPIFISGLGPIPAFGIGGSGLATTISTFTGLIGLIATIYARDMPLRLRGRELRFVWPSRTLARVLTAKGLPITLQSFVLAAGSFTMAGLVNREGAHAIAAFSAAAQVWIYLQMPANAVGAAVSAMAAQSIGAERSERLRPILRTGLIEGCLVTLTVAAASMGFGRLVLGIFIPADSSSLHLAEHIVDVTALSYVLVTASAILMSLVRAHGAVVAPFIISAVTMLPVRLGLAIALHPVLGAEALWWSVPLSSAVSLVLAWLYYANGSWRHARADATRESDRMRGRR